MAGSARIRGQGKFGGSIALALLGALILAPAVFAGQNEADDEPVGWPLAKNDKARIEREQRRQQPAAPLPQRSAVTDRALAAWVDSAASTPGGSQALDRTPLPAAQVQSFAMPAESAGAAIIENEGGSAAAPARIASPEIAPLKRITPPVRHELILYAPGDFSISVGTARRLAQMAMRLRGTRDRISIVAHSHSGLGPGSGPGSGTEDAQISTHEAVKLSFKRAMLVRLYLIDEGVSPDQIDLEALPQANDDGPTDRVEISPTSKTVRR